MRNSIKHCWICWVIVLVLCGTVGSAQAATSAVEPPQTLEQARDAARAFHSKLGAAKQPFTVQLKPGTYELSQLRLDARDSHTTYQATPGSVTITGGQTLAPGDFEPVRGVAKQRLSKQAQRHVLQVDLRALGLDAGDWGALYGTGFANINRMYDHGEGSYPCELYVNHQRMRLARYPNQGWLKIGEVLDPGQPREVAGIATEWKESRNPRGATFRMDAKTARRVKRWAVDPDLWIAGFFCYDWADDSTRLLSIDKAEGTLTTEHNSSYGFRSHKKEMNTGDGTYYIYNILEELDQAGEWYLDRDSGILYLWPPSGTWSKTELMLALGTETLIVGRELQNLTFDGVTFEGTRAGAIDLFGDDLTLKNCTFRNCSVFAAKLNGTGNTIENNTAYHLGGSGFTVNGGDLTKLISGNNRIMNNVIHDVSEVRRTYSGAVNVYGPGAIAAGNEIFNAPHTAIFFGGNNQIIEKNIIHDVNRFNSDSGAIYSGRSWFQSYGTEVRYNLIYNTGSPGYKPVGIYFDDGLSGVAAKSNLLMNIPGWAIEIGGGRSVVCTGNIMLGTGTPIEYDARARNTFLRGSGGFPWAVRDSSIWKDLLASPWQTEIWKNAYPHLAEVSVDYNHPDDPRFAANPANSVITGNWGISEGKLLWAWDGGAWQYSTVAPNKETRLWKGNKLLQWGTGAGLRLVDRLPPTLRERVHETIFAFLEQEPQFN